MSSVVGRRSSLSAAAAATVGMQPRSASMAGVRGACGGGHVTSVVGVERLADRALPEVRA